MKINKGIVKNINKKLIAGLLAISLSTTFTGCSQIKDVKYTKDEAGYINGIDGTVSLKFLNSCKFAKVYNRITEESYYTIALNTDFDGFWNDEGSEHYDLFTRQDYENKGAFSVEYLDAVINWIESFGMSKDRYTEEELRELLNKFIEKQEEKDKQLVKE